ncbi:MAG: PilZ domain-containing protein [Candidatus Omnitrophica bacterium]|nr:PilZ domain-containing protein [Candidatus Omnitrophota bacterium]
MKFNEKRKASRFKMAMPVDYRMLRASQEAKRKSFTSDISIGGVRFIADEFLALTARMVIDINLPVPERSVSAVSKIAWIRKLPDDDKYEIGNQFLEMSRDDKERLSNYLNRLATP